MAISGLCLLLVGETGVGKELIAREIHRIGEHCGDRAGPFVTLDCANLPSDDGTLARQFQRANHGTLFLADLDELARPLQAQLLRILEDREVVPVGSHESLPVDVRLIAAVQARASSLRDAGQLRADLYYRVCECMIEIPPLRARGSDVRLLADFFLSSLRSDQRLSTSAYEALERCAWPGNVRELASVIRRAALLHPERPLLGPECLFESPPPERRPQVDLGRLLDCPWEQAKEEFARWYWTTIWRALAGDRRRIAEHARVSDVWLRSRRKLYELHDAEPLSGFDGETTPLSGAP